MIKYLTKIDIDQSLITVAMSIDKCLVPGGRVAKNKVLDMGMKTTVSDYGLFQRAWVGGWSHTTSAQCLKIEGNALA